MSDLPEGQLRLGPLLRFVDDSSATIWVETAEAATVVVEAGEVDGSARTFAAHGHHYALVEVTGLPAGTPTPYRVLSTTRSCGRRTTGVRRLPAVGDPDAEARASRCAWPSARAG